MRSQSEQQGMRKRKRTAQEKDVQEQTDHGTRDTENGETQVEQVRPQFVRVQSEAVAWEPPDKGLRVLARPEAGSSKCGNFIR
eukprot:g9590.t1